MAVPVQPASIALATLDLLEIRLRRLEFAITGKTRLSPQNPPSKHEQTIAQRMSSLERGLEQLAKNSSVVSDLLQLRRKILFPWYDTDPS